MAAGATYEPISSTTLTTAQTSVTFSSLGTYTDLRVIVSTRDTQSGTGHSIVALQFNSDTATNYSWVELNGSGTTGSGNSASPVNVLRIGWHPNAGTTAGVRSLVIGDIFNYAGSTYKTALGMSADDTNGGGYVVRNVGTWRSTAAITSVTVTDSFGTSFESGSTFALYGIKAA